LNYIVIKELLDEYEQNVCYLLKGQIHKGILSDDWNDYHYHTIYTLRRNNKDIGIIKIGEFNMLENQWSPNLPVEFTSLDSRRFFSIGYSDDYYSTISETNDEALFDILMDLNDFTVSLEVYERAKSEAVTKYSLLRYTPEKEWDSYIKGFYDLLLPPLKLIASRNL